MQHDQRPRATTYKKAKAHGILRNGCTRAWLIQA